MISLDELNPQQKQAVIDDSNVLRIIAGAGSGKTRVLTMRIVYLIEEEKVLPRSILAITFTNKAANEMKNRIEKMLGDKGSGTFISTIHSLCLRILSEDIESLNYPRNFSIADSDDQRQILKEAYKEYNLDKNFFPYGQMLNYISNNKYEDIDPLHAMKLAYNDENELKKAEVYQYYIKRLNSIYALDFDDLILWTLKMFKKYTNILEKWSGRFQYVLVDEFQDVDKKQYELIKLLSSYHHRLYVVGDPDQTIYTWRGADVNIINNFNNDYPDARTITLNQNYRSTNNILGAANSLIKNNKNRVDKELYSRQGDGDKIIHLSTNSEEEEAYFVLREIEKLHRAGINYKDMAILYRSNYLSRPFEKVLMENKIPYVIYGGLRFYERAEIKDILAYLRLVITGDDLAFCRIINIPKRGIGQITLDNIREIAEENDLSMYEVVKQGLYTKNTTVFNNFVNMVENWKKTLEKKDLNNLLQNVLDDSGYREMLEKNKETERLENIKSLLDDIKNYRENFPEEGLAEYLRNVSLYTDKNERQISDALSLLTIHSAKGLEFDIVFVVGLSQGIFPSAKADNEGLKGREEERRLAYVAYTRAKKRLYLTDNFQFSYVYQSAKTTSCFVKEVDKKYLNDLNVSEKEEKVKLNQIDNRSNISSKTTKIIFKKGDLVHHNIFGDGVVLKIDGQYATIAFPYPHNQKTILANHPALSKK